MLQAKETRTVAQRQKHAWPNEIQQGGNYGQSKKVRNEMRAQGEGKPHHGGGPYRTLKNFWLWP